MYGGAAVTLVGIFVNVTTLGDIRQQRPIMSAAFQTSSARQAIAEFIVGGLIAAAIWAVMAIFCQNGSRWARMTGTALFAIYTVYATELVVGLDNVNPPGAVQAYSVVLWACGLAATVLLWHRGASAHFRASARACGADRACGHRRGLLVLGDGWNLTGAPSVPHVLAGRSARS